MNSDVNFNFESTIVNDSASFSNGIKYQQVVREVTRTEGIQSTVGNFVNTI
jgi:hypothetical protein